MTIPFRGLMEQRLSIAFEKDEILSSGRSNETRLSSGRSQPPIKNSESSTALGTTMSVTSIQPPDSVASPAIPKPNEAKQDAAQIAETVSKFQLDLKQKDELIAALIHELEMAVEQLDRFERSGADRATSSHSLSPANDLPESRSPLMDDLRQMAEDWEQTQPGALLTRIESQLAAVHDLVLHLQRDDRPRTESTSFTSIEDRVRQLYHEPAATTEQDTVNMTLDESSPSWDAIKNQILNAEPASPVADVSTADAEILKLMTETPTPQEVNFGEADLDELKKAIVERDSYIIQLNRLFRTRNTLSLPTDWATLAQVPAEMQIRVESLIEHLDVQVRLGEVEMSLERARLARERSYIQSERELIEKHMKRLGLTSLAELDNISAATGNASDRRWMRFLGPNTK